MLEVGDDLLEVSLPDGASLAEVVESVFVLAGDLPESILVASLFESVLKPSFFVDDGALNDGVPDDGSGDGSMRVQRDTNGNDTVSEGISYGMLFAGLAAVEVIDAVRASPSRDNCRHGLRRGPRQPHP